MQTIKSLGWSLSLMLLAGAWVGALPSYGRSYADITGTNIWNNNAPIFETGDDLDPELLERIERFNEEATATYNSCNAALDSIGENPVGPRRFARRPSNQTASLPIACQQLEQLRGEADELAAEIDRVQASRSNPDLQTW